MHTIHAAFHDMRKGWSAVVIFYLVLLVVSYLAYHYALRLQATRPLQIDNLVRLASSPTEIGEGLRRVWFIFAWGFGVQFLVQCLQVIRRRAKDGDFTFLLKRAAWLSANAGLFEELIFRYYAYLSFVVVLFYLDHLLQGWLAKLATGAILPLANLVTLGFFHDQFVTANWAVGVALIIGSGFFRSAHIHYGKFSKANVWVIGLVMFWLTFHYGLLTAIAAHFLYDFCVFAAIALTSPFQPRPRTRA